jgi:hypothetical protein
VAGYFRECLRHFLFLAGTFSSAFLSFGAFTFPQFLAELPAGGPLLRHGVVVHQADAEEAAGFFHVEMLGQVEGVVVSVPGEEAALAEFGGEFQRRVAGFPGNGFLRRVCRSGWSKRAGSVMP